MLWATFLVNFDGHAADTRSPAGNRLLYSASAQHERPHPSMAVGDEEVLGQRLRVDGFQEVLQGHPLAVHPALQTTLTRVDRQ